MGEKTCVVFRVDRDGIVFALMPYEAADVAGLLCTTYQHVGQHSSADYVHCIRTSRPAKPSEYASLYAELEARGYRVRVIQSASSRLRARAGTVRQ